MVAKVGIHPNSPDIHRRFQNHTHQEPARDDIFVRRRSPVPVKGTVIMARPAMPLLGGSWVVISGVISPLIRVITIVTLLITPLISTHEPPSRPEP